jgi:hypothetical protein
VPGSLKIAPSGLPEGAEPALIFSFQARSLIVTPDPVATHNTVVERLLDELLKFREVKSGKPGVEIGKRCDEFFLAAKIGDGEGKVEERFGDPELNDLVRSVAKSPIDFPISLL